MAFFGLNQKPGRGLSREEASKREYFGIFGRKIWQMIQINLLFFVCNILIIMRLCDFMILVSTVFSARFAMTGN